MADSSLPETFIEGYHDRDAVSRMPYNELGGTGLRVSRVGIGTVALAGFYLPNTEEESIRVVRTGIQKGVNYLDTSPWYGNTEELLGKALDGVPRNAYYIATKVGRYPDMNPRRMFDFSAERVTRSVDDSLQKLRVSYVDIIQVHDFEYAPNVKDATNVDIIVNETLPALQKVVESGKARFIGITCYPAHLLKEVIERSKVRVDMVLSYARACLLNDDLADYQSFFQERNIGVVNGSPMGCGLLTPAPAPTWHPATPDIIKAAKDAANLCQERGQFLPRLAMHYAINRPYVHTTLCSTEKVEILLDNLALPGAQLTEPENDSIHEIKERLFALLTRTHFEGNELGTLKRLLKEEDESGTERCFKIN